MRGGEVGRMKARRQDEDQSWSLSYERDVGLIDGVYAMPYSKWDRYFYRVVEALMIFEILRRLHSSG